MLDQDLYYIFHWKDEAGMGKGDWLVSKILGHRDCPRVPGTCHWDDLGQGECWLGV